MSRFRLAALCILCLLLVSLPAGAIPLPDSVDKAIAQVQDTAQTVKNFSVLLYDIVSFFTKLFGFSAILLLTAVILTSSGFVSVGIPAGRVAFFSSLMFWDTLWVLWLISAGTLNADALISFALINAKVVAPFALFDCGKMALLFCVNLIRNARIKRLGFSSGEYLAASKRLYAAHGAVQDALLTVISRKNKSSGDADLLGSVVALRDECDRIIKGEAACAVNPEESNNNL